MYEKRGADRGTTEEPGGKPPADDSTDASGWDKAPDSPSWKKSSNSVKPSDIAQG